MKILRLVTKNILRHKLRSFLTILGIAIAVMAFGLLRTVVSAWYIGVEGSAANRLIVRHAVSFIFPLPLAYEERIARIPGVEKVTHLNWFNGVYIDKKQFFARLAVDADTFFDVYPECLVSADQLATFKSERNACVVGEQLVQRYNLKIGDIMPIEGDIYPGRWEFVIRGIYKPRDKVTDPSNMYFHWQYLDERVKQETPERSGYIGWFAVKITNSSEAARISDAIDGMFKNSRAETKSETEREFQSDFLAGAGAILAALNAISIVIIGIIMLVLGNTMIMAARERVREYAVFKTLGFSARHLVGLIGGESLLISLIGGTIGLALTFPLAAAFEAVLPKGWFPVFTVEPMTIVLAALAAFLVGILASLFPIYKAVRTSIVEGIRQIG